MMRATFLIFPTAHSCVACVQCHGAQCSCHVARHGRESNLMGNKINICSEQAASCHQRRPCCRPNPISDALARLRQPRRHMRKGQTLLIRRFVQALLCDITMDMAGNVRLPPRPQEAAPSFVTYHVTTTNNEHDPTSGLQPCRPKTIPRPLMDCIVVCLCFAHPAS